MYNDYMDISMYNDYMDISIYNDYMDISIYNDYMDISIYNDYTIYPYIMIIRYIHIPVVPHKAVAEVSKIGNL